MDKAGYLPNDLFLCKGALVKLTQGIFPRLGLLKNTVGKVIDIVYLPKSDKSKNVLNETMPDFIVLEIKDYKGTNTLLPGKKIYSNISLNN